MTSRHWMALAIATLAAAQEPISARLAVDTQSRALSPQTTVPVAGVVVDVSGVPVPRASVMLNEVEATRTYTDVTDESGRFRFSSVEQGRYALAAWSTGYPLVHHGAAFVGEPGVLVTFVAARPPDDLTITLRKGGAISGTVRDEFGDSIGVRVFARHAMGTTVLGVTDQHGRYRLPYLQPGSYIVGIAPGLQASVTSLDASGQERQVTLGPAWYGGSSASAALPVRIGVESDITGIDMVARYVPAAPLAITIQAPGPMTGQPTLELAGEGGAGILYREWDGTTYRIDGIGAGRYTLVATGTVVLPDRTERLRGRADVTLDGFAAATITLALERGARVTGRIAFDGKSPPPRMEPSLFLKPVAGSAGMADGLVLGFIEGGLRALPEGLLSTFSISPGEYVVQVQSSMATTMGWTLTSATMDGQDILDLPIQLAANSVSTVALTLSDRSTELSGRVTDAEGRPQPGLTLVVFSADQRHWYAGSRRVRQALPDARGDYRVAGLPPGDYRLAAISGGLDLPNGLVAGLTELSTGAIRFSLALGEQRRQDLRTGKGPGISVPGGLFAFSDRVPTP